MKTPDPKDTTEQRFFLLVQFHNPFILRSPVTYQTCSTSCKIKRVTQLDQQKEVSLKNRIWYSYITI